MFLSFIRSLELTCTPATGEKTGAALATAAIMAIVIVVNFMVVDREVCR